MPEEVPTTQFFWQVFEVRKRTVLPQGGDEKKGSFFELVNALVHEGVGSNYNAAWRQVNSTLTIRTCKLMSLAQRMLWL